MLKSKKKKVLPGEQMVEGNLEGVHGASVASGRGLTQSKTPRVISKVGGKKQHPQAHLRQGGGLCSTQADGELLIYTRQGLTRLLLLINCPAVTATGSVQGINSCLSQPGAGSCRARRVSGRRARLMVITIHAGEDTLFPRQWQRR